MLNNIQNHLIFKVKNQNFTVNVNQVSSILRLPKIYKVPQAPKYILGVTNIESRVVPVIDAGLKLDMGNLNTHEKSQIIVLERNDSTKGLQNLAFLVSDVLNVEEVDELKIQDLPTSKYAFDERMVDGMHKILDDFCMQINLENFFNEEVEAVIKD